MNRAYYSNSIIHFLKENENKILGELLLNHTNRLLEEQQKNAWIQQIQILKKQLSPFDGQIYFEFSIPRMGKRVDNIIIIDEVIFVLEFKIGSEVYDKYAIDQVIDYTLDLKNFHEGSHHAKLIPVLISTEAHIVENDKVKISNLVSVSKTNKLNLTKTIQSFLTHTNSPINHFNWENSIYKPTPTIVEAAQALYKGHNVKEISRSDAGAINLSKTTTCINNIIDITKKRKGKAICFVTGVPGSGKTLAGLNIATERMKIAEEEHAVFLSGNGPLVYVLKEALIRDEVSSSKILGKSLTKKEAAIKTNPFIQNIHNFRDDKLISKEAPIEKVVVFDEAQRAWTIDQTKKFMKRKKGLDNFIMSEPHFLIDVMNRHKNWSVIICLIGGGQEINTGEAGMEEWVLALKEYFQDWQIYYSKVITEDSNYIKSEILKNWLLKNASLEQDLHLSVSIRSFRSEKLSDFVTYLLDNNLEKAKKLYQSLKNNYPIVITRNLELAKNWLKNNARGTERIGIISSSGARRLRPCGIDVKNDIDAANWFLNGKDDVRSSYYLEDTATEFDIQGLEIDWSCFAWGANFYKLNSDWVYQKFKGSKWQRINKEVDKLYLKNTYRVLLTRARQGMVIFIPSGHKTDKTRKPIYYDETYRYLKQLGIVEL